ncbi:metalloprotease [Vannielia sp.]|uniref:metalloprotease n=1 Tax=Vannielia sp. TaxID=2813045 RepID=UPI002603E132|nr:metalloprotease [Vannielia sp.]MDF1872137.1 metalloprotease [Vannielia sp.]
MTALLFAFALCAFTMFCLRGGLVSATGLRVHSLDRNGLMMGAAAFALAAWVFGPLYGIALTASVVIHEFGHVAAYRVAGHTDARFRLVPLFGGVAISNRVPDTQAESFFITLMGPGICLAPMVLSYALSDYFLWRAPEVSRALWVFAAVTGLMNFFNLLPYWPLDGGRCVKILAETFWKPLGRIAAFAMSAALAATALWMQSTLLFFFAFFSAQSLFSGQDESTFQRPMTKGQGTLAAFAYLFTLAAHFWGGYALLDRYII